MGHLSRSSGRCSSRERACVGAELIHVELFGVEPAAESGQREREVAPELLPEAQGREVHQRLEEVAARVVQRAVSFEVRVRQRPRLFDPVLGALVRERDIGLAGFQPDLREELSDSRLRDVAPAVLAEERAGDVVVEGRRRPSDLQAVLLAPEAPALDAGDDLVHGRPASRDDVDDAAEGIAAEQRGRAADHFQALDVVERQEVEVDFLHRRLVDPHAIDEDAQPLRFARDRCGPEATEREVHLPRIALLIVRRHAGQTCQRFLERHGAGGAEPIARHDIDRRRNARERQGRARQARRRGDAQLGQPCRVFFRPLGRRRRPLRVRR